MNIEAWLSPKVEQVSLRRSDLPARDRFPYPVQPQCPSSPAVLMVLGMLWWFLVSGAPLPSSPSLCMCVHVHAHKHAGGSSLENPIGLCASPVAEFTEPASSWWSDLGIFSEQITLQSVSLSSCHLIEGSGRVLFRTKGHCLGGRGWNSEGSKPN